LVSIFLESAELRAKDRRSLSTSFWKENVDRILRFQDKEILQHKGTISSAEMKDKVKQLYDRYHQRRKSTAAHEADLQDLEELQILKAKIRKEK